MALNGSETLYVLGQDGAGSPAATEQITTTGAIAALAELANLPGAVNTAITTVGNGTLTAAGLVGGIITRTGPVAAYTDTTATGTQIIDALIAYVEDGNNFLYVRNTLPFIQTIAAGTDVTLTGDALVPANSVGVFLLTYTSETTVTMLRVGTIPLTTNALEVNTAITTVGAGVLTGAGIAGGVITRSGSTAVYTDTTDTAANIIAAMPNANIGQSFELVVKNTVGFAQTITGGTGVTVSGISIVPANSAVRFLVTYTAAATVTMVGLYASSLAQLPIEAITTLSTVGAGTITGAGIAGRITSRTGSQSGTPFTDTTDTAANIITALPNANIGVSFEYTYQNTTNAVATLTGGTGVTVSGITAVPAGFSARYLVTYTAAATITMVGFSSGQSIAASQQSVILAGSTSGTTIVKASATAGSTTQTHPAVTGVVASTSGANLYIADVTRTSAAVTKNASDVYANVTGLSATVVPGTYRFRAVLPSTVASGTAGIKYAFNYTTTVLTSIEATGIGYTSAAVAVQHTTTTTTQTDLFTQAAVVIMTIIEGTTVVGTGGTIDVQMAQNTSNASDTVALVGGSLEFVRIA